MNRYDLNSFNLETLTEAVKKFMEGKPINNNIDKKKYDSPYVQLTREEVLSLKNGDVCYIMSSWGMQKSIYPSLSGDTHRNLFGKGGSNKNN